MTHAPISRRRLLAAIGGGTAASVAGLALSTGGSRAYTDTVQLRTEAIEGLVHPDASGTFGDVADALEEGVVLDASPNTPGTSCLEDDGEVTVTFGWAFPPNQEDINTAQGETIEFDLVFDVTQC